MNIYTAAANIDASDCQVYIIPSLGSTLKILLDSQGKLYSMEKLPDSSSRIEFPLSYISTVNQFTLMPNLSIEQIPEDAIAKFLKWGDSKDQSIIKNKLLFDNTSILFQIPKERHTQSYPAANFKHAVELLVNQSMLSTHKDTLTTFLVENQLMLSVITNGKLQLSNIFQVDNNEEVIYYIMLMFQELNLDAEKVTVQLFGECEESPFLEKNLSGFIRNITTHKHPNISNMKYSGIAKFIENIQ